MTDAPYILIALTGSTLIAASLLVMLMMVNIRHQLEILRLLRAALRATPTDPAEADPPLPVDEARPPGVRVYDGWPAGARCSCHGELLRSGSTTMVWPLPDSDEIRVFCELSIPGRPS